MLLGHGQAPLPGELWSTWHAEPLVLVGLVLLVGLYLRGRGRDATWRRWCFAGGITALAVALLSPLDALAGALASAHMVQHLLLTLVAAPLLAVAAPGGALLRGAPPVVRLRVSRWRRTLRMTGSVTHLLRRPVVAWGAAVVTLWLWHAEVLYDAALSRPFVHALQHTSFLLTAVLFWRVAVGTRAVRAYPGLAVLLLFMTTVQNALLALLLTFADTPWYGGYATTTLPWGLEQLADQHLAGAIMWVPAGFIYLGAALTVLAGWLRSTGAGDPSYGGDAPPAPAAAT